MINIGWHFEHLVEHENTCKQTERQKNGEGRKSKKKCQDKVAQPVRTRSGFGYIALYEAVYLSIGYSKLLVVARVRKLMRYIFYI